MPAAAQLLAWGWNARGTLGHGHRATERKPRYVSELRGVRIVQAAIGGWHCLAVDDRGQARNLEPPNRLPCFSSKCLLTTSKKHSLIRRRLGALR